MAMNIVWHNTQISKQDRVKLTQQKPCVLWFTGLKGELQNFTGVNDVYEEPQHAEIVIR